MSDFEYPNLLSGTRTGKGWTRTGGTGNNGFDRGTGLELFNLKSGECFLWSPDVVLHTGRTYTLSFYAASTANMSSCDIFVLDTGGYGDGYQWVGANKLAFNPPAGGAWTTWTFSLVPNARDGATFRVRFDNNGSTDGKNCLIWFRDIMLTEGTEPRAWAPAEGENLAEGGALMSADLIAGYAPNLVSGTTKYTGQQVTPECDLFSSTAYTAANHADTTVHYASNGNFPTLSKLTSNQAVTMSFGVKAASSTSFSAGKLNAWVMYKDAAGNANWVNTSAQSETISQSGWTRIAGTVVVPSGMTIAGCGVSKYQGAGAFIQTDVTLSYGSGLPVAEETFTPFETASHAQTEYATYASQKILSDSITAEVTARTKTDRMVSEVSSRLTQTADGFNASIDRLSDTDKKVNAWFDFEADSSGNPQLKMGSSTSPVVGTYTNTGLAYRSRDGATIMELDASRSATISDHMEAQDMKLGKWKWVQTQGGTHLTLVWAG